MQFLPVTDIRWMSLLLFAALICSFALAQEVSPPAQIEGIVRDQAGNPMAGVSVFLQEPAASKPAETQTTENGAFVFAAVRAGNYTIKLQKTGFRDAVEGPLQLAAAETKHYDFVMSSAPLSSATAIELDDRPSFTVAGITDSTGSGGHGSETRMRTGEVLARETLKLETAGSKAPPTIAATGSPSSTSENALRAALLRAPGSFQSSHELGEFYLNSDRCHDAIPWLATAYQINRSDLANALDLALAYEACEEFVRAREQVNQMLANENGLEKQDEADLHRLLGDVDEKLGDPLDAVREYERAAALGASEQNYFSWGAELLLHRAAVPAIEVFGRGAHLHPGSARMLAGLGAALYASGSAEEAAQRLCQASDLEPANSAPYLFLGKMQESSSTALPCAEQRLARFAQEQAANALANYYYGLSLWKRGRGTEDSDAVRHAEILLEKSCRLDPKLDVAFLHLGNLYAVRGDLPRAVSAYQKAIAANPLSSEAHYRLGSAYKRSGDGAKAQSEFEQYKQLEKTETAGIERQRRELRQFLFTLKDDTNASHSASGQNSPSVSK